MTSNYLLFQCINVNAELPTRAKSAVALMRISSSVDLGLPAECDVRYWFSFWAAGWLRDATAAVFFVFFFVYELSFDSHGYINFCFAWLRNLFQFSCFLIIVFVSKIFEVIFKSTSFSNFCISSVSLTNFRSNSYTLWQIFKVWSGFGVGEDRVGTDAGDSGVLIFDDAVFRLWRKWWHYSNFFGRADNGAFNSKFIILRFFAFSQEDDELTFLFKDERFYSVILAWPNFAALGFFLMVSKYPLTYLSASDCLIPGWASL